MKEEIRKGVSRLKNELIELRRNFHRYPELGFKEERTATIVADYLKGVGLEVETGIAGTGVAGVLRGNPEGKTLLLRADMDALPISEQNDFEYRSRNEGVMHACGHDGHMAILLATAKLLSNYQKQIRGNIKFVFQPAEEGPGGAKPMIEHGVLANPSVDAALGLHLWNYLPVGKVGIRSGPLMASMDRFTIKIKGKSTHGAIPEDGVDAIVMSGQVISALQTIVSREVSPLKSAVVTLGTIQGGYGFNTIADEVRMEGTARALDGELRKTIPERMERILKGITSSMRGNYDFQYQFLYPVTVNDEGMVRLIQKVCASVLGAENVSIAEQTMGGEDMAFFLQRVPGCYFFLGSASQEKGLEIPHHHPHFNFDEGALQIGVEILSTAALTFLK